MSKNRKVLLVILILFLFLFLLVNTVYLLSLSSTNKCRENFGNTIIPLHLYQTWNVKDLDKNMNDTVNKVKTLNPEFQYHLFDDNDCAEFIKNNFDPDVYNAYNSLIPGAYKADLWRYCILYKNGGIYLDIKYYNVNGFKFINLTDNEYFCKDIEPNGGGVYNAIMICKPNNNKLLNCINNIVLNVKNKYYGEGSLYPTGPMLLKKEFTNDEIKNMKLSIGENNCPTKTCINLHGEPILAIYKGYYETRKMEKKSYHDYWSEKKNYS